MRSNQKVEENQPALKFNFTQEYMHPYMILRHYNSHRALPYRLMQIALTTAEGWNGRFDPFFLQKVFFIYVMRSQNFFDRFLGVFTLPKWPKVPSVSPQRASFQKLRGAPQFLKTAVHLHRQVSSIQSPKRWFSKIEGRPSISRNRTAMHYYRYCLHHRHK